MTDNQSRSPCSKCGKTTKARCSKCKSVYYCSKPCQAEDWKVHKIFCSSLPFPKSQKTQGNPDIINSDLKTITGILLSPDSLAPKLIEIPMDISFENMMLPNTELYLGECTGNNYMQSNPFKETNLKDTLVFSYRDNFLNDGSPLNRCIQNIYMGKNDYPWRGPVLVFKMKGLEVAWNEYADMTTNDLEDVVDYFCWYGKR